MATKTDTSRVVRKMLRAAPVKLRALVDGISPADLHAVSQELIGFAEAAAFAARYLQSRIDWGLDTGKPSSDTGHKRAVSAANTARKTVRKTFGYHITLEIRV